MDEVTTGAPSTEQPKDDLRSTIEAAFSDNAKGSEAPTETGAPTATEQPAASGDRYRDEHGRFVAKPGEPAAAVDPQVPAGPAAQLNEGATSPSSQPAPPPGWSVAGKAAFDALPDSVKTDIARREVEISNGFAKLADYKGLDPWVEMARSNGRTLPEVVQTYVAAEQQLEQDFSQGILSLCQMYNVDPARLGQFLVGGQPQGSQPPAAPDQFAPLVNRLSTIEQQLEQREIAGIQAELQRFAADPANRYFENVRQVMGQLMATNPQASLSDVYDQACWLNPEIRALRIKEQNDAETARARAATDSARRASGSLPNGSPIPGAVSGDGPAPTLRAELERQFAAARI